ncbi:MAG: hypothetical protein ACI9RG_001109, partial [Sulfurimonas sp.]
RLYTDISRVADWEADTIIHLLKPVQAHTLTITSDNGKEDLMNIPMD